MYLHFNNGNPERNIFSALYDTETLHEDELVGFPSMELFQPSLEQVFDTHFVQLYF